MYATKTQAIKSWLPKEADIMFIHSTSANETSLVVYAYRGRITAVRIFPIGDEWCASIDYEQHISEIDNLNVLTT